MRIVEPILDDMGIAHHLLGVDADVAKIKPAIDKAYRRIAAGGVPGRAEPESIMMKRDECFRILARHITDEAVVATYSSAVDWVEVAPRPLNYLSIGAMGLDSSHGLGLALGRPDRRVVVLQGDGSLLMNLGSLVTIAAAAPKNLVHFVAHNDTYEANGGHPIPNPKVDFANMARVGGLRGDLRFFRPAHVRAADRARARTGRAGLRHAPRRAVEAAQIRLCEPLRPGEAQGVQGRVADALGARLE